jgi:hypothetical protein
MAYTYIVAKNVKLIAKEHGKSVDKTFLENLDCEVNKTLMTWLTTAPNRRVYNKRVKQG